jgi:elongator complex protein 4
MGFQKKSFVIGQTQPHEQTHPEPGPGAASKALERFQLLEGVRPSPLDGRLTTSSGTPSLDQLLAGHSGLPLGASLVLEEHGTTDFGGIALRYFAAQGLVHGHHVHVLGYGEAWTMELPGLVDGPTASKRKTQSSLPGSKEGGSLKIAWRYESLGMMREREGGSTGKVGKS